MFAGYLFSGVATGGPGVWFSSGLVRKAFILWKILNSDIFYQSGQFRPSPLGYFLTTPLYLISVLNSFQPLLFPGGASSTMQDVLWVKCQLRCVSFVLFWFISQLSDLTVGFDSFSRWHWADYCTNSSRLGSLKSSKLFVIHVCCTKDYLTLSGEAISFINSGVASMQWTDEWISLSSLFTFCTEWLVRVYT